jgi:rare lipoprotein A
MARLTPTPARWAVLAAAALLLGGCAEAQLVAHTAKQVRDAVPTSERAVPAGRYKVGKPYQVAGVWYYPKADYDYEETGIASWYGPGFHGQRTANGEIYDQGDLTAAHRTLPMPSMVRVTNLENGRALKLRVNDRGPFARGRIIDVSARAAELLGFKQQGTAKVRVEIVEPESRRLAAGRAPEPGASAPRGAPVARVETASLEETAGAPDTGPGAPAGASPEGPDDRADLAARRDTDGPGEADGVVVQGPAEETDIYVQAGAFTRYDNATRLRARLASLGRVRIDPAMVKDRQFFRVRIGPVADVDAADRLLERLVQNGYTRSRVVVD